MWKWFTLAGAALSLVLFWFLEHGGLGRVESDIAYINASPIHLRSAVSDHVEHLQGKEGDDVTAGQSVIQMNTDDWSQAHRTEVLRMKTLLATQAELNALTPLKKSQMDLDAQAVEVQEKAKQKAWAAWQRLADWKVPSAKKDEEAAFQQYAEQSNILQQSSERALLSKQQWTLHNSLREQNNLSLQKSMMDVADLERRRERYDLNSPSDATIVKYHVQEGEYVQAGQLLATLYPKDGMWLDVYFKETSLSKLAVNQSVQIVLDAYPNQPVPGKIVSISAVAGAVVSGVTPNYTAGNFTRIVQKIPVRVEFDNRALPHVAAGMSATVRVIK